MVKRIVPALLIVMASTQVACLGSGGGEKTDTAAVTEKVLDQPDDLDPTIQLKAASNLAALDQQGASAESLDPNANADADTAVALVPAEELNDQNATATGGH